MTTRGRRAFIALFPPDEIAGRITEHLLDEAPHIRWMPAGNLHVTMVFRRKVADPLRWAETLHDRLAGLAPVTLRLNGVETVPGSRETMVWLSVAPETPEDAEGLNALRVACGAPVDHHPHVTLARVPEELVASARWAVQTMPPLSWRAREVGLYTSTLGEGPRGRSRYDLIERYRLETPTPPGPPPRPRLR